VRVRECVRGVRGRDRGGVIPLSTREKKEWQQGGFCVTFRTKTHWPGLECATMRAPPPWCHPRTRWLLILRWDAGPAQPPPALTFSYNSQLQGRVIRKSVCVCVWVCGRWGCSIRCVRKGDAKYKARPPCPYSKLQEKHHGDVLQAAVGVGGVGREVRGVGATLQMTYHPWPFF